MTIEDLLYRDFKINDNHSYNELIDYLRAYKIEYYKLNARNKQKDYIISLLNNELSDKDTEIKKLKSDILQKTNDNTILLNSIKNKPNIFKQLFSWKK